MASIWLKNKLILLDWASLRPGWVTCFSVFFHPVPSPFQLHIQQLDPRETRSSWQAAAGYRS